MHNVSIPRHRYDELNEVWDTFVAWGEASSALVGVKTDGPAYPQAKADEERTYDNMYLLFKKLRGT